MESFHLPDPYITNAQLTCRQPAPCPTDVPLGSAPTRDTHPRAPRGSRPSAHQDSGGLPPARAQHVVSIHWVVCLSEANYEPMNSEFCPPDIAVSVESWLTDRGCEEGLPRRPRRMLGSHKAPPSCQGRGRRDLCVACDQRLERPLRLSSLWRTISGPTRASLRSLLHMLMQPCPPFLFTSCYAREVTQTYGSEQHAWGELRRSYAQPSFTHVCQSS